MNIFKVNSEIGTYSYPVIKIVISGVFIIITVFRGYFLQTSNTYVDLIISILSVFVVVACVLQIYISAAEIIILNEKRTNNKEKNNISQIMTNKMDVNTVALMIEKNDIIDIEILFENELINIGASSNQITGRSDYYDKRYYIGDSSFIDCDSFKTKLVSFANKEMLQVVSIDGVCPDK